MSIIHHDIVLFDFFFNLVYDDKFDNDLKRTVKVRVTKESR